MEVDQHPVDNLPQLILEEWRTNFDLFEFRVFASLSVISLRTNAKKLSQLFQIVLDSTEVRVVPFEVKEEWDSSEAQLVPVFTDIGISLYANINKKTIPPGLYLFLITPSSGDSHDRINVARSIICSLLGHTSAFQEVHRITINIADDKTSVASNFFRQPTVEDSIALFPHEESLEKLRSSLKSLTQLGASKDAFNYFCKAINESDGGLRMFLFILSIESAGGKKDFSSAITEAYRPSFKTQHEVRSYFDLDWYRDFRNEFAHKAISKDYNGKKERLIQLLFIDTVASRYGGYRLGLGQKFVEDFGK